MGWLVTYDSVYGATTAAAMHIAEALAEQGIEADLHPIGVEDISNYDAIVLGSPIHMGRCTKAVKQFLKKNRMALTSKQVAFFFTCMSVFSKEYRSSFPLYVDPSFDDPNRPPARLRFMADNHTVSYYLNQFLKLTPGSQPVAIAFFRGRLRMADLKLIHRLLMRFAKFALPEVQDGDFLNPTVIRTWAQSLQGMAS
jgi:menaquinone-dependent protoporphyrinogen IX oxidase